MAKRLALAAVALLIGACDESPEGRATAGQGASAGSALAETPAAGNPAALVLACATPFTPDATAGTLAAAFGAQNVIPETIDGPEGEKINVTAVYPNDPTKRIEVYFKDEEARTGLLSATVREGTSKWTGPGGIRIGDEIGKVEAANGGEFQLVGFDWDYGGFVSDWRDGKLKDTASGCRATVRFIRDPDNNDASIAGDSEFSSDLPAIRAAKPTVSEFGISW